MWLLRHTNVATRILNHNHEVALRRGSIMDDVAIVAMVHDDTPWSSRLVRVRRSSISIFCTRTLKQNRHIQLKGVLYPLQQVALTGTGKPIVNLDFHFLVKIL